MATTPNYGLPVIDTSPSKAHDPLPQIRDFQLAVDAALKIAADDEINVQAPAYGAKGNGIADDTTAIQSAINAAVGKVVSFPPGTYLIGAAGLNGLSNQRWAGAGAGTTIIKLNANPSGDMINFSSKSKFSIEGISFDYNNKTPPGTNSTLGIALCSDFVIRDCRFINQATFGIGCNSITRGHIIHNYIARGSTSNSQNEGILVSTSAGDCADNTIEHNELVNTAMDLSGHGYKIHHNTITGFGFGGGITFESDASTYENDISENAITGGVGTDVNATVVPGIENWGARTTIRGNIITNNSGDGIDQGGKDGVIADNVISGNGITPGFNGITLRYGDATYNASGTSLSGNRVFGSPQVYGLAFQGSLITGVHLGVGNNFEGNVTGTILFSGATLDTLFNPGHDSYINSTGGNIGFGTAAPGTKVDISLANNDFLRIRESGSVTPNRVFLGDVNNAGYLDLRDSLGNVKTLLNAGRDSYVNSTGGKFGIGTAAPSANLHSLSTTEQLRLGYDASNFASFAVGSTGNLAITPTGTLINLPNTVQLQASNYASQVTGWAISGPGSIDCRYLYTDELHAKSFIADLEQALAGGQIISKSVAETNTTFTLPAAGGAGALVVKDLPSAAGMAVFQSGDIIRLRQFSRAAGSLTIADAWGVVTGFVNNGDGTQSWTFTRSTGARAGTATGTISNKTLDLDYGVSGNGFYEVNAIDGAYGVNSPYAQIVTWTTHPQDGQVVRTRMGNLKGITTTTEYGLYAGDGGVGATNKFVRISDLNFEVHNIGIQLYESSTLTMSLQPTGPYFALGNPMPTSYLQASTTGIWMGNAGSSTYKFRIGTTNGSSVLTAGLMWDGTLLSILGSVTATSGVIGGWTIGATSLTSGSGATTVGLDSGGTNPAIYAGSATPGSAPFRVTNAGAMTATSGAIGGWSITSTDIENAGATVMLRGAGNLAFGATPPTSASVGTGLFLDSTGMYGLKTNVVQAKFDATTGAITAGAGGVLLDVNGMGLIAGTGNPSFIKWTDGGVRVGSIAVNYLFGGVLSINAIGKSADTGGDTSVSIQAQNSSFNGVQFVLHAQGTASNVSWAEFANTGGTFSGITLGATGIPNAMLDVRGGGVFSGLVGVGTIAPIGKLHVSSNSAGNDGKIYVDRFTADNSPATIWWRKGRGTAASPGDVLNGDFLGEFPALGYFNGGWRTAADILYFVDGAPSGSVVAGGFAFYTTNAAGTFAERMRLNAEGRLGLGGTPATSGALDVQSTTGAFIPPRMTTTQRDALTAVDGMVLYNTTLATMQYRKAGAWVSI